MRTIAHISDLHFGRVNCAILPALTAVINAVRPDVVAVSGDLTQRARSKEFGAAREFLATLPEPQIVVPGNHDVPLYDIFRRWWSPLKRYRKYISDDLEPFFADEEIAVLGVNTARSFTFKNGRINAIQVANSCNRLGKGAQNGVRILVTHHPFGVEERGGADIVGRADMAMTEFARCRIDVILTGHLHVSGISSSAAHYALPGYSALFIHAGTATSVRQRGEVNAWNLIHIDGEAISVDCFVWDATHQKFTITKTSNFRRGPEGWSEA
ncbi:MAG: metallophosphoesterase [Alphaproteobacteria bacterium]|nr:metallophosphoesterase [Alphaproteobacteria bacterium]